MALSFLWALLSPSLRPHGAASRQQKKIQPFFAALDVSDLCQVRCNFKQIGSRQQWLFLPFLYLFIF